MFEDILGMVFALSGTVCIIFLTYYASKWYAKKIGPIAGGKHIKVIDRVPVTKASSIIIIELNNHQYMLGVSEQRVEVLMELDEKVKQIPESENAIDNFGNIFKSIGKRKGSE